MDKLFGGTLEHQKTEYKAIKQQRRHFAVTNYVHYLNDWNFNPVQLYPDPLAKSRCTCSIDQQPMSEFKLISRSAD